MDMSGNGEFLKTTLLMSLGVVVGAVVVAQVLSLKAVSELSLAGLAGRIEAATRSTAGLPDPLVTGSVGQPAAGQTIILDPCTGKRRL
jgi:hypothetical protein